jgi:hypothetical protein
MHVEVGDEQVVKTASTEADRRQLASEAVALAGAAHPGVVRLLEVRDDALILGRVQGGALSDRGPQPVEIVAGWGAALATTLGDLHDIGYAHGAIEAEHVLFDEAGRPVLCSFNRAVGPGAPNWDGVAAADVSALAGLIAERLPAGAPKRLSRALSRAYRGSTVWGRRVDARWLARLLVQHVPGARLEGATPALEERRAAKQARVRRGWGTLSRRRAGVITTGAVVIALSILIARPGAGTGRGRMAVYHSVQILTAAGQRYEISAPAGERLGEVEGPWRCGGATNLVLLDRGSGLVWLFDRWPTTGVRVPAQALVRVAGAVGVTVDPTGKPCGSLVVTRISGSPVVVRVSS